MGMSSFSWTFLFLLIGAGLGMMIPGLRPVSAGLVVVVCLGLALLLKDM
jgi:hypothetical protein